MLNIFSREIASLQKEILKLNKRNEEQGLMISEGHKREFELLKENRELFFENRKLRKAGKHDRTASNV